MLEGVLNFISNAEEKDGPLYCPSSSYCHHIDVIETFLFEWIVFL
jgi:hypothetical protein